MKRITHPALPGLFATILFALVGPPIASAQTITSFSVSGASNTFSAAINASGTIAGEYLDGAGLHGFLRAPNGTITTIDPPFCPVGTTSIVSSSTINSSGAVVGDCGIPSRVFLRDPLGNFIEISPPGNNASDGMGVFPSINDIGEIAGSYTDASSLTHGFVVSAPYAAANYTSFDVPAPAGTYAEDHTGIDPVSLNNSGQVAGYYFISSNAADGFLRNADNTFTTFPPPLAGARIQVAGMNDTAAITGSYTPDNSNYLGFVQQGGTTTSFSVPGKTQTFAEGINLSGTIVGYGGTAFNNDIGFVRNPLGGITTFVVSGASNTQPVDVNDLGVIAGTWLNASFARSGFIATPTVTAAAPASGTTCNGTYNGTFIGNVTVTAGQSCNFVGGTIEGNVTLNGGMMSLSGSDILGDIDAFNAAGDAEDEADLQLLDSIISGNISVKGDSLKLTDSEVDGNVSFDGENIPFPVDMGADPSVIKGNLRITNLSASSSASLCGITVQGNLQVQNNAGRVVIGSPSASCPGNTVGGNLQVNNNSTGATSTTIYGNAIKGNLQDNNNLATTGSAAISSNTVGGNLQVNNNEDLTTIDLNHVSNNLQCQDNSPAPNDAGGANTASSKQGQCSGF